MKYPRLLDMRTLSRRKSFFLFGPRSTGKTTLLRDQFSPEAVINLLRSAEFLPLAENPSSLAERVREICRRHSVVIIDEIQKLPTLLDEVHHLIEEDGTVFILTGSSGRKLRHGGVNLLAGRAWQAELFPLVSREIPDFDLNRYLSFGGLPQVYTSEYPREELDAYLHTYLREEVQEEARVQNLVHFGRFLKVAALANAEQLNYANVANDSGIPATTVRGWFEILNDTFLGFTLEAWRESGTRKVTSTAKFYLFDVGVWNVLRGSTSLVRGSTEFGKAFEHWIAMELRAWLSYSRTKLTLRFWRTYTGLEVDFIIGTAIAVEVKSASRVTDRHCRGLRAFRDEAPDCALLLVSFDENNRTTDDGLRLLHWR
jgi:predicted AAA+ superfamily ATPase